MEHKITEFINIRERIESLNNNFNSDFCILPENIESATSVDEFIFTDNATTVKKVFHNNNVSIDILQNSNSAFRQRCSIDWYAPMIFIGYSLLSENSNLITVGLNVLSNYITDFFKGSFGRKNVKIEIVVESSPKKEYKCISYEGSPEGLKDLEKVIKALKK